MLILPNINRTIPLSSFVKSNIGLLTIKDDRNLFQRLALRLEKPSVGNEALDRQDDNVDDIKAPAYVLESDGVDVLVHKHSSLGREHVGGHALCTDGERQDFDGVSDRQGRECDAVEDLVHKDESENGDAGGAGVRLCKTSGSDGPAHEDCEHADRGDSEQGSSADTFDKEGGREGKAEIPDVDKSVYESLGVLILDSHGVHDSSYY